MFLLRLFLLISFCSCFCWIFLWLLIFSQTDGYRRDVQLLSDVLDRPRRASPKIQLFQLGSSNLLLAPFANGLPQSHRIPLVLKHPQWRARVQNLKRRTPNVLPKLNCNHRIRAWFEAAAFRVVDIFSCYLFYKKLIHFI